MRSDAGGTPRLSAAGGADVVESEPAAVGPGGVDANFMAVGRVALQAGPVDACAALTVLEDGGARAVWSSDLSAAGLDSVQYRARAGPSVQAASGSGWTTAAVEELLGPRACPPLTAAAGRAGIGSMLSVGLAFYAPALVLPRRGRQATTGSLTLYAAHPEAFTTTVVDTVLAVTSHVAFGLAAKARVEAAERSRDELAEQLRDGLDSRVAVGRAQGILMERYRMSAPRALGLLHRASGGGRTVRDVADDVVRSAEGGPLVSDVFEREDLRSAHSCLRRLGVSPSDLAAASEELGDAEHVDADPHALQVPPV